MSQALLALSPLDGRYASRARALGDHFSEFALIRWRVRVEVKWLQALAEEPAFTFLKPFSAEANAALNDAAKSFSVADAERVKAIEAETNHDVKAVEYWMRERFQGSREIAEAGEFIHFACTSEDINNLCHALMVRGGRDDVLLPALDKVIAALRDLAHKHASVPMLSRTHLSLIHI